MKSYRFLEHATDAIVETKSDSIENAFLAAADATIDLTVNKSSVDEKESIFFEAKGEDMHYLLYSWLEEIIYVMITKGFAIKHVTIESVLLPNSIVVVDDDNDNDNDDNNNSNYNVDVHDFKHNDDKINSLYIRAKAHGEPIDLIRHGFKVEIKAPTFHDMVITESDGTVLMRFLLDL